MEENKLQKELFKSIMRVNKAMGKRHSALGDLPQGTFVLLHTILENHSACQHMQRPPSGLCMHCAFR